MPEGRTYGRDGDLTGTRFGWRAARGKRERGQSQRIQPLFGITSEARKRERRDFASSLAPSDGEARARARARRDPTNRRRSLSAAMPARVGRPRARGI